MGDAARSCEEREAKDIRRPFTEEQRQRFYAKVRKEESPGGHWIWRGAKTSKAKTKGKFGQVRIWGVAYGAHVAALLFEGRAVPAGHEVVHLCDVLHCVNPLHLEVMTPEEKCARARALADQSECLYGHGPQHRARTPKGHIRCRVCHAKVKREWVREARKDPVQAEKIRIIQERWRATRLATIRGITKSVGEWAKDFGVKESTMYARIFNDQRPPDEPRRRYVTISDEKLKDVFARHRAGESLCALAQETGVTYQHLRKLVTGTVCVERMKALGLL